ncbi:MAG TPA: MOSC domain-containing protein [Candidatus Paceibacterota bacterium]|nr:MOSC domain-containing protein [Candidatus Paceibacterota bacterium]
MKGQVVDIYITDDAGRPMRQVSWVRAVEGKGLEGDRYAEGRGAFTNAKRRTIRQVSFLALEDLRRVNTGREQPFTMADTRRNIVVQGVDLLSLIGREFTVGSARFRGVEHCSPCARPSVLSGKPGFKEAFHERGGLRAEVLEEGIITTGSAVATVD